MNNIRDILARGGEQYFIYSLCFQMTFQGNFIPEGTGIVNDQGIGNPVG